MKNLCTLAVFLTFAVGAGVQTTLAQKPPIIDMHLHALPAEFLGEAGPPNPVTLKPSAATTDDALLKATLVEMERYNIVRAITSGPLDIVQRWVAAAPDRIIGSPLFPYPKWGPSPALGLLREKYIAGHLGAMGEITAQYEGLSPSDDALEPYLALAEELDIPVGFHMGGGPPGAPYRCCPKFRLRLGNPLLLEELLIRHPKLRVYIMHAGHPYLHETIAIMDMYRHVYADIAAINWMLPREEFHEYLRQLVLAGFSDRLMFGSDQALWPEAIGMAIKGVESAEFLSEAQKRDIFYNNAVRFLRLNQGTSATR